MPHSMLLLSLHAAAAEIQLAVTLLFLLLMGVFLAPRPAVSLAAALSIGTLFGLGLMFFFHLSQFSQGAAALSPLRLPFYGMFAYDILSQLTKLIVVAGSLVVCILALPWVQRQAQPSYEFFVLLLLAVLGLCLMASSNNFLTFYLGLELQSLAAYVLVAFRRDSVLSSEAGLKYFVLGALSSGMLLFGISLLYGFSGSVGFREIGEAVSAAKGETALLLPLLFGAIFVLAGLAFKLSAAPFHMWAPDVYEGAPTPVVAFLAAVPKIAVFALLIRLGAVFGSAESGVQWPVLLAILAVASMTIGAVAAIAQSNIKRLLAYSSIGHMGYALLALVAPGPDSLSALFQYMIVYSAATLGAFAALSLVHKGQEGVETIADLAGLARTQPLTAYALAVIILSMAGLPIFAGFFAKLAVFNGVVNAGYYGLAVTGVLASAVAAYYYLHLCKVMFFDEPASGVTVQCAPLVRAVLLSSAAFCLLFIVYPAGSLQSTVQRLMDMALPLF